MASAATIGYGSKLRRGDGATPENFTDIAEVFSIEPPSQESDDVEVTNLDSPNRMKEYIAGMGEPGEVSFEMNFLPTHATQDATTGLIEARVSGDVGNWQIEFSDAASTTATFSGYVKAFQPALAVSDRLTASCTIKVTGPVTWA